MTRSHLFLFMTLSTTGFMTNESYHNPFFILVWDLYTHIYMHTFTHFFLHINVCGVELKIYLSLRFDLPCSFTVTVVYYKAFYQSNFISLLLVENICH